MNDTNESTAVISFQRLYKEFQSGVSESSSLMTRLNFEGKFILFHFILIMFYFYFGSIFATACLLFCTLNCWMIMLTDHAEEEEFCIDWGLPQESLFPSVVLWASIPYNWCHLDGQLRLLASTFKGWSIKDIHTEAGREVMSKVDKCVMQCNVN